MEDSEPTKRVSRVQLTLAGSKTLTIDDTAVVLHDPHGRQNRTSSKKRTFVDGAAIPLYNILWSEVVDGYLHLAFASQASKSLLRPEQLLLKLIESDETHASAIAFVDALLSAAYGDAQQRKRAYVLVNPNSGPGHGVRKWEDEIRPLFEAARLHFDAVILTHGGEATELVAKLDIDKYDTIVACSGDGTPHEVFNGLAKRPDATTALQTIPVSHMPCGSGNAMSCNLYGSHRPSYAALAMIKGITIPLDLVSITQGNRRIVSFLSQALGLIAESDLATENLRWMGSLRFEVGVLARMFRRRCYPCDVAIKTEIADKASIKEHYWRYANDNNLEQAQNGLNYEQPADTALPKLKYGTVLDSLPDGWELISYEKIGNFYSGNMAYVAHDVNFFAAALASDGCMDLITMNGNLSPQKAIKALLTVDSAKFFDNPIVSYKKISAYRIIPRNQKSGYISIDGERVPFEPFQAEIHPRLGRVIAKRRLYAAPGPLH